MILLAPVIYSSRQISVLFALFAYLFLAQLIFAADRVGDIYSYVRQLETLTFYQDEFVFGALQLFLTGAGLDADSSVKWLQISLALLFFAVLGRPFGSGYFILFPFFQIFVLNSLRQGYATVGILAGLLLLMSQRPYLAVVPFILAIGFHSSAAAIGAAAGLMFLSRKMILRSTHASLFIVALASISAIVAVGSMLPNLLGYGHYLRVEDFTLTSRESTLMRTAFFIFYGVAPLFFMGSATALGQKTLILRSSAYIAFGLLTTLNLADGATRIAYYFMAVDVVFISLKGSWHRIFFKSRRIGYIIFTTAMLNPAGAKMIAQYLNPIP